MRLFNKNKKRSKTSKIIDIVLIALLLVVLVSPDAKSLMIQGLMKIGLFSPKIPKTEKMADLPEKVMAPEAVFTDVEGKEVKMSELQGKVVFINFWATWCPPCRAEMPTIYKLYEKFKDNKDIVFLMVDVDEPLDKALKYLKKNKWNFPLYQNNMIPETYLGGAIPTTVVVDKLGQIVLRHEGATDYSHPKVMEFIRDLADA